MKPPGWHPALLLALLFWPGPADFQEVGGENGEPTEKENIDVSISGTSITLACPLGSDTNKAEQITISHNGKKITEGKNDKHTLKNYHESNNGLYQCEVSYENNVPSLTTKLHLKAKVCELCVEMESWTVILIMVVDFLITLGVVILVYNWSKNKKGQSERAGGHGSKPKGYSKERPPPVPNPDYEPIRKGQRDLYDGLNSRAY
ncbi:T-cell surface glycoprotein CD3 epsilon chain [Microcaecilia unicolor]|uniref:T-cell surface glycoprotein CD3 epsilon chain n=1 Tax=Microcaecilia unicolor TaxID=1415580 RepID=A0A6P7ZFT3_9AMPH|nr:T-cell surface glycoprotein CD3 epsilon chain [Microcaecilia unicolor]